MIQPPLPLDEAARLDSLYALRIMDTQAEERFDRITRMAQRIFGVQICLISLVDSSRQWFKSRQGLDVCETSRDISFCGHAILGDKVFVVGDAKTDPRFMENPLVTGEPFIRFYAGCSVRGPSGHRLGTLCLIDPEPRGMSMEDQGTLRDFAAMVEDELALTEKMIVDELTQISNRQGFNMVARHILPLCRRLHSPAEVVFFDLDRFKETNDNFGHDAGDRMLQHFADLLTRCFRSADVVARLGGDEFIVLMADTDTSSDSALKRLEKLAVDSSEKIEGKLAWSVGRVAFDPHRHTTIESVLADADTRMYEDKIRRRMTGS